MIRKIMFRIMAVSLFGLCLGCVSYPVVSGDGRFAGPLDYRDVVPASVVEQCETLSEGFYVVQAGVFKKIANAQALRKKLEEKGYPSYITVSGFEEEKRVFRVLFGRFADVKDAQRVAEEIKSREKLEAIAVLKPPRDKYVVQAGCFREISAAKTLRKTLADRGHNAYIILSRVGNEVRYNVILGEFLNLAEAERVSREIREKEKIQAFVNTL